MTITADDADKSAPHDSVSIVETLARHATSLHYDQLPTDVVKQTKRVLIDTIGCAIGGAKSNPGRIAIEFARTVSANPGATVIGTDHRTSADLAAFANGVLLRVLDYNDAIVGYGGGHPSDTIAALLPTAEIAGRNGRDLILATVLAYDCFCGVATVFDADGAGMDNATQGGLAGTLGASRLLGLTEEQTAHAAAIYVAGNVALLQSRRGKVSNWKNCSPASACRNGVFAAQLAQRGLTGPEQVFEGRHGFFSLLKLEPFVLPQLGGGADRPFPIMRSIIKKFQLGQWAQSIAQAVIELRPFVPHVDEIAEVTTHVAKRAIGIMADTPDKWRPQNQETADHSIPFSTAVLLTYGTIDDRHYDDKYFHDQRLIDLMSRVKVAEWEEANRRRQETSMCEVEVVLKSGARKTARVEYQRGHPGNPMTDAEIEEKFHRLVDGSLSRQGADRLLKALWSLEQVTDLCGLMASTASSK